MSEAATSARSTPAPGSVLAGKYRVERVLGEGGMGFVLAAMHTHLEERVAMKLLRPEIAKNPEFVARFLREAKAAIRIRSEHVVRVLDVGTLDTSEPYMVMEYLEGSDLEALLARSGPQPFMVVVDYVLQACEALAEAHVQGMVHRDLKPANLFVTKRADGTALVKVLDFGISKVTGTGAADHAMTRTNAVMGSPQYMSPEQMRSTRKVDARADVWALGTILHELLTGAPPFRATTMPELCAAILQDMPPPLRLTRPDAPAGLERLIARCLEKDPADRFQNVAELATALEEFASPSGRASVARVRGVLQTAGLATTGAAVAPPPRPSQDAISPLSGTVALPSGVAAASTETSFGNTGVSKPNRRAAVVGAAVGALSLVVIAVVVIVVQHTRGAAATASTSSPPPTTSATAVERPTPVPPAPSAVAAPTPTPIVDVSALPAYESTGPQRHAEHAKHDARPAAAAPSAVHSAAPANNAGLFDTRK